MIQGFKKFKNIEIDFDKGKNIIVGENEAGKSTILEAINIVLNQKYRTQDKYVIKDMLNTDDVADFKSEPKISKLPSIRIGVDLDLDKSNISNMDYFGENNISESEKYGILFECSFDEDEYGDLLSEQILKGEIPIEYYHLSWKTYQGSVYKIMKKPLKSILINTTADDSENSFNYYNKTVFKNKYSDEIIMKAKNEFRENIDRALEEISLEGLDNDKRFGINHKKVILNNIISIYDGSIPLESKGSGVENLIKTEIALNKQKNNIDVVLIEEPENHLSHGNLLKMINKIEEKINEGQLIITTHSDLIASRLDLRNIIWISENKAMKLSDVDKDTAKFFSKADNNNLLQFLLSNKVILVEGATEYLMLPNIYSKITNSSIEMDNISIISCRNLSYKRYLEVAKNLRKRIAVVTDNDGNEANVTYKNDYNSKNLNSHIFSDNNVENWTWEACFYNINSDFLDKNILTEEKYQYLFHKKDYGKTLGKMLNNKAETAFEMLDWVDNLEIPEYIKDMIAWIKE